MHCRLALILHAVTIAISISPPSRIVTAAGAPIAVLEGMPATSAAFLQNPAALAFSSDGGVIIADVARNVLRRVTPGGAVFTLAGGGSPAVCSDKAWAPTVPMDMVPGLPWQASGGLANDGVGGVYFSDSFNHVVRRLFANGSVAVVAGICGVGYFHGDGGAATLANLRVPVGLAVDRGGWEHGSC